MPKLPLFVDMGVELRNEAKGLWYVVTLKWFHYYKLGMYNVVLHSLVFNKHIHSNYLRQN